MTSTITATTSPFEIVARAPQPITSAVVKEAVAAAPEELKSHITEDVILRDLHEIITTAAFGDKTPKLADDVAAKVGALKAAKGASGFNNTATAFFDVLNQPHKPNAIYKNAHYLEAMLTGAVVALEAELASKTDEQKADKKALIESFSSSIAGTKTLKMFASVWASMAEPTGDGTFALPHETAQAIAESIKEGTVNEKLKGILFSKLKPGEMGSLGGKEVLPSAEEAAASAATAERERTRPIGGKTQEQLEALYKDVAAKSQVARITYRPETLRPDKYQQIVNALNRGPMAQILTPMIKEYIGRYNVQQRRAQKANYTEISAQNAAKVDDKQLQAIYKIAQRAAERMGAGNPSVTRIAQDVLNAWVSSVDIDNPHITYFSHLQDIVWDGEKGDWLKFHVDAQGKLCEADAPGAKEISCELLVEVVFLHELTHIFEGAVLNQYMLAIILGVFLDGKSAKLHGEGCLCNSCGAITEKVELAQGLMSDPKVQAFMKDGSQNSARLAVARELGIEDIVATSLKYASSIGPDGQLTMNAQLSAAEKEEAQAAFDGLAGFFLMFTREGESTADHGAVRLMGPEAPRWMAMAFDIISRSSGKGSPAERLAAIKESYTRDHRAAADEKLEYSEEGDRVSHTQFALATTHPTRPLRALGNYEAAESEGALAAWAFEAKPPATRLLGAAQAIESEMDRIEDHNADYQHGAPKDKPADTPEQILKTNEKSRTRRALAKQQERMRIVTSEIAKLAFADGLDTKGGRIPYAKQIGDFMKEEGEPIFRPESAGANPLAALLGGGGASSPACTKMAKQLAEELQKLVDASKPSEPERAAWKEIIDLYESIASGSAGAKAARIERTKAKAMMRTMRGNM